MRFYSRSCEIFKGTQKKKTPSALTDKVFFQNLIFIVVSV